MVVVSNPQHGVLLQMVQQNDEKHEEGHGRLRRDLRALEVRVDDRFNELGREVLDQKLRMARMAVTKERRRELSGYKAVIIAAAIGGGFRLIEVLIQQGSQFIKGGP